MDSGVAGAVVEAGAAAEAAGWEEAVAGVGVVDSAAVRPAAGFPAAVGRRPGRVVAGALGAVSPVGVRAFNPARDLALALANVHRLVREEGGPGSVSCRPVESQGATAPGVARASAPVSVRGSVPVSGRPRCRASAAQLELAWEMEIGLRTSRRRVRNGRQICRTGWPIAIA